MIARHAPWRCGGHYCCNFRHMRHPSPAVPQALPAQCSEMPESFSEIPERASSAGAAHGDWRAIAMNVVSASRAFERSAVYFVRKCNSRSASAGARVPTQEERCLSGNAAWPRRHRTMPRSRTPRTSPPPRAKVATRRSSTTIADECDHRGDGASRRRRARPCSTQNVRSDVRALPHRTARAKVAHAWGVIATDACAAAVDLLLRSAASAVSISDPPRAVPRRCLPRQCGLAWFAAWRLPPRHDGSASAPARAAPTMHRKPRWHAAVSMSCTMRAAGRWCWQ